ncbi:oxidoreductase [Coniochaeta ligniaria NRRL 30616]|uniref:Oxidoreductase n=1 Tax=Coniochaeta ligniaria NRRL 30616 TaxID=1408157 RepID=A0A1J7ID77_9PEZI|nr:oxidoreductase [Coniochaeta ligniaria NRRL 30616]
MRSSTIVPSILGAVATIAAASLPPASHLDISSLSWALLPTKSTQQFRGLSPVSDKIAYVSGTGGTVLHTTDGGLSWSSVGPVLSPEDAGLEFRDIEAITADHVALLSIGEGTDSRIYVTRDGGATWTQAFTNPEPAAFYDCIAFTSARNGVAVSDPVDGKFRLVETDDGGASWTLVDPAGMPDARDGEFGFAASGTCLGAGVGNRMYLASGGVDPGRVFRSGDGGRSWEVADTPIAGGAAAGVFSVRFRDAKHGIAVGGDYTAPNVTADTAAWSRDGGVTWQAASVFPGGYRSGSAWVPGLCGAAIAVGPTGSDVTFDGGKTWATFDNGSFDSVQCPQPGVCWASGTGGRVAKLKFTWATTLAA